MLELIRNFIPNLVAKYMLSALDYEYAILEGSYVLNEEPLPPATGSLGYFHLDISEGTIVFTIMLTSLLAVSIHCLTTLDFRLKKKQSFYNKLLTITDKLNFEDRLKDTCSMLIDRYFLYNALQSVDQLLLKTNLTSVTEVMSVQDKIKDHSATVSVEKLKSQIKLIRNQSETRQELDLVQRVSDLCVYVESFHVLNGSDGSSVELGSSSLETCLSREGIRSEEGSTNNENNTASETNNKINSKESLTQQTEDQMNDNDSEENWENKVGTVKNNQRRKEIRDDIHEGVLIKNAKDAVQNEDNVVVKVNTENQEGDNKVKGKVGLKKPYNTKKIKSKKLGTNRNTDLFQGKDKMHLVSKGSLISYQKSSAELIMKNLNGCKNSVDHMKDVGARSCPIKNNLSLLISKQSKDSLKSIAATVLSSQEKISESKRLVNGSKVILKTNKPSFNAHSAKTSEFKINTYLKKNPSPHNLQRKTLISTPKEDRNGQKKCTNEQIKKRLERGYDKLRKVSENCRDVNIM